MGVWEDILITKFACFELLPHIDWSQAVSGGGGIFAVKMPFFSGKTAEKVIGVN